MILSMPSVWNMIFTLLAVELVINIMLVMHKICLPVRKTLVNTIRLVYSSTIMQLATIVLAVLLVYQFGFSYYTQNRLTEQLVSDRATGIVVDATKELSVRVRIFREQRNMYLSGFAFFHGIVMWRIVNLYKTFDNTLEEVKGEVDGPDTRNDDEKVEVETN